jgi:protein-S-isoprenylcysteine O-methyltransferase Ste14
MQPQAMQQPGASRPTTVPWPPVLIAAFIAAAFVMGRLLPLPWPGLDDLGARIVGSAFGAAGLALIAWGFVTLHRAGTTIMPNKGVDRLVTEGAFGFRRNPIYMGETLVFLGLAELTHNIWFVLAAPLFAIAILVLAILPEERHLEERFGQAYLDYKERTRRWF